jgi:PEP-CTERM motif
MSRVSSRSSLAAVVVVVAAAAVLLFTAGPLVAAPFKYDEAVDGDLSDINPPHFLFDAGDNEIRGTAVLFGSGNTQRDSFAFTVPAGMRVTAATTFAANGFEPPSTISNSTWNLNAGSAAFNGGSLVEAISLNVDPTISVSYTVINVPLAAGVYNVSHQSITGNPTFTGLLDYVHHIQVELVPEPASLGLLAAAALGLLRRRR